MDIPGVSFYIENKRLFPLSGIQPSKMPMYEFQGVPITGHKVDTQCLLEVKDTKYSNNIHPEKKGFGFTKSERLSAKRDMCGHFSSFPAISFSQLVGGFVGSKSQNRLANREACQIWDVIFSQFAETACQSTSMQSDTHQYFNFGKTFSQNLIDSFCRGSGPTLGGIASYLVSQNCEFLQEQEIIHSMSVSDFRNQKVLLESSMNVFKAESKPTLHAETPQHSILLDRTTALELNPMSSLPSFPKQSYAEVAKSMTLKSECQISTQPFNRSSINTKIPPRLVKKMKNQECKSSSISKPEYVNSTLHTHSLHTMKNYSQCLNKTGISSVCKEPKISCSKSESQGMTEISNHLPMFNKSPWDTKKKIQNFKGKELSIRPASKGGNWRERDESVDCIGQGSFQTDSSGEYKHFNVVYPAFHGKNHTTSAKPREVHKSNPLSKYFQNNKTSTKAGASTNTKKSRPSNDHTEISPFGRKFKHRSKSYHVKMKEIHEGRRHQERENLCTDDGNMCGNWRCKHVGVVCRNTSDCGRFVSARKNITVSIPKNIPEPCVMAHSKIISSDGEDSIGNESLQSLDTGPVGSPGVVSESSIDCISISSSCGDISDASDNRKRILSECSVDSDDSFIVFFESECVEEMSPGNRSMREICQRTAFDVGASDCWSDCESDNSTEDSENEDEDQDEVDFVFFSPSLSIPAPKFHCTDGALSPLPDRLKDINETWRKENLSVSSEHKSPQKVHFPNCHKLATVHPMVKWDFAYRAARCGPWEEMARDRTRFRARIDRMESILSPILTPEHRCRIKQRMDSSAIL